MALAFRRACTAAEDAFKGYVSHFKDYYGFTVDAPVIFDWESAKAIAGSSKFNSNSEELPRSITVVNSITSYPNYLSGMVSNIAYKAGDDHKALAFTLQRKHFDTITLHFDDKSTVKGECTWTCEVRDRSVHATMHFNFDQYCGRQNYEHVCEWILDYLEEKEQLLFEVERAKYEVDSAKSSCWYSINSDGVAYLRDACPGKKFTIAWDEMKTVPGKSIIYSNKPPVHNPFVLQYALNDGKLMYVVHWALDHVLKDAMGKEAFAETFDEVVVRAQPGSAHAGAVTKEGKVLTFNFTIKMDDHQNASRAIEYAVLGKAIENLL